MVRNKYDLGCYGEDCGSRLMIYLLNQTNLQIYNLYKLLDEKPRIEVLPGLCEVDDKWNEKFDQNFQFLSENLDLKQTHHRLSKIILAVIKKVITTKKGKISMGYR